MIYCVIDKQTRIVTAINLTREEALARAPKEIFLLQEDYVNAPQLGHLLSKDNTQMTVPSTEQLRTIRDELLEATDWRATVDYPGIDQEAWLTYRQELRDLPANYLLGSWVTSPE